MIASVGPVLPLPLLRATGRYRGALGWNVEREMPFAGRWLECEVSVLGGLDPGRLGRRASSTI